MNNYNHIDLDKVKERVATYAYIEDSKSFILNEEVNFNPLVINRNIKETSELLELIKKDIYISFDGIENINSILDKSIKNIVLNSLEVSKILNFHNHCKRIKNILNNLEGELTIKDYTDSIYLNDNLASELNNAVDNYGIIKDDASSKLKEILNNIESNEKQLYDTAHSFINKHLNSLQEPSIYLRNNRVTFLVKNSDKNKFNGYTYGTSASGLASYVEPEILINLNNNHISFEEDKQDEIKRILTRLTYLVAEYANEYSNDYDSIMKLCSSYAKAYYGYKNNCIIGKISDNELYLKDVCHPLIDENNVVPNTYKLSDNYKGIVISGTNTGGKTVGLKCIGLSTLMTYLGIPIIASEASIPLYKNVFVDMDDNQSISNSLSTFSAHISNINNILNNADNKSLILIDELISGTDPKEAQAISLAILNKIERMGATFVITTHYDDIKNYAYKNDNILLSSVGFDNVNLIPTYKYIENSVGASNALEIADRYFDDKDLINYAKNIIENSSTKQDQLIEKLSKEIEENELIKNNLNAQLEVANKKVIEYENKINEFNKSKDILKKKYEDELNEYIQNVKDLAIEKLETISSNKDTNIIKEIEELSISDEEKTDTFEIGDNVKVGDGDRIGTISSLNKNKVEVIVNGLTLKTDIANLTKMPKTSVKEYKDRTIIRKTIRHELVIVGKHIDEALDELEVFLDEALSNNLSQVKIIHGIGTGQLKNAVRSKLKKLSFVKEYNDGDYHDGGSAVTMVKLK